MIISASRRTDIPAFYSRWFINRIRDGFCEVPNPYNPKQVSVISLALKDVEAIVFWTRYARPLLPYLDELDELGYRYYFQYTLVDYPQWLEPKKIPLEKAIDAFVELSDRIGPERVIWRYDPIIFGTGLGVDFHKHRFEYLSRSLRGHSQRVVVSLVDLYAKLKRRMAELREMGFEMADQNAVSEKSFAELMAWFAQQARACDMEIFSCAEDLDLDVYGIKPGKCIDDELIEDLFRINVSHRKDPAQRKSCRCVLSRDIGMYDTCGFGCKYCYASSSMDREKENLRRHDPESPQIFEGS